MHTAPQLLQLADQCVKCGMCLPHCPTYQKTADEAESPRGRIALIQGLTGNQLAFSPRLLEHLENCLKCRACENICPSQVPYGELIDGALTHIERTHPTKAHMQKWKHRALNLVAVKPVMSAAHFALRLYQRLGLRALLRAAGILDALGLKRWDALLPELSKRERWRRYYAPQNIHQGDVALFTGCIADITDQATARAAITLLTRLGYGVHVPPSQRCCGALHLHNGAPEHAAALARTNLASFGTAPVTAIISTASGCGATLAEYFKLTALNDAERDLARGFASKVTDISTFLGSLAWPSNVMLRPLPQRVAVHDPCSLTHILHQSEQPYALLNKIPHIELVALAEKTRCCGAAGSYMITHPAMASTLREDKLRDIEKLGVRTLVSSNIGCALHLAAGLTEQHPAIEVIHPVVLLARQLG